MVICKDSDTSQFLLKRAAKNEEVEVCNSLKGGGGSAQFFKEICPTLCVALANSFSLCIKDVPTSPSPRMPLVSRGVATAVDAQFHK